MDMAEYEQRIADEVTAPRRISELRAENERLLADDALHRDQFVEKDRHIEALRAELAAARAVVERLKETVRRYEPEPGCCEHGVSDGDWCDKCHREIVRALYDNGCGECGEDCTRCSGEYCEQHGAEPCDCDVIDRHKKKITRTAAEAAQKARE